MYLKPVKIYYKVSEILTFIYEFVWSSTWGDNRKLTYSSYYESRKNDENDIWGHLWSEIKPSGCGSQKMISQLTNIGIYDINAIKKTWKENY